MGKKERNLKCPVCPFQSSSLRGVAIHIVMKRDYAHNAWRNMNWIHGTSENAVELAPRIMEILQR